MLDVGSHQNTAATTLSNTSSEGQAVLNVGPSAHGSHHTQQHSSEGQAVLHVGAHQHTAATTRNNNNNSERQAELYLGLTSTR